MDWNLVPQILGGVGGIGLTLVTLTWWLSRQFHAQTEKFFTRMDILFEKMMIKLEYHEKHDDNRFSEIRNDLAEIRVQNAYVDAKLGRAFDKENTRRKTRASAIGGSLS